MRETAELHGVHVERIAGLLGGVEPEDAAQQKDERAAEVALQTRGVQLGVEGMARRKRAASVGAEQPVPGAGHGAAGGVPAAETALGGSRLQHVPQIGARRREPAALGQRQQGGGVALALVDPHDPVREGRRAAA